MCSEAPVIMPICSPRICKAERVKVPVPRKFVPPAPQIYSAMQAKSPEAVASGLVAAFTTHLASVGGLWTGFTPVGVPLPFPWVGIA